MGLALLLSGAASLGNESWRHGTLFLVGGGCGSGTLYTVGGGSTRMLVTLAAFCVGAFAGSLDMGRWAAAPSLGSVSLAGELGWEAALPLQLGVLVLIWLGVRIWARGAEQRPLCLPSCLKNRKDTRPRKSTDWFRTLGRVGVQAVDERRHNGAVDGETGVALIGLDRPLRPRTRNAVDGADRVAEPL